MRCDNGTMACDRGPNGGTSGTYSGHVQRAGVETAGVDYHTLSGLPGVLFMMVGRVGAVWLKRKASDAIYLICGASIAVEIDPCHLGAQTASRCAGDGPEYQPHGQPGTTRYTQDRCAVVRAGQETAQNTW